MTTKEIEVQNKRYTETLINLEENLVSYAKSFMFQGLRWLGEIAYQLAKMNERNEMRDNEIKRHDGRYDSELLNRDFEGPKG